MLYPVLTIHLITMDNASSLIHTLQHLPVQITSLYFPPDVLTSLCQTPWTPIPDIQESLANQGNLLNSLYSR